MASKKAPARDARYNPLSTEQWMTLSPEGQPQISGMKLHPGVRTDRQAPLVTSDFGDSGQVTFNRIDHPEFGRRYRLTVDQRPPKDYMTLSIPGSFFDTNQWNDWVRWCPGIVQVWSRPSRIILEAVLPSVTTMLDTVLGQSPELLAWRDSIGHEDAARITEESAIRGTNVHKMCEMYVQGGMQLLLNEEVTHLKREGRGYTPLEWTIFHMIRQHLDTFDEFIAVEVTVFNLLQGYSGTIDLVGRKGDKTILVDLKTYGRERKDDQLHKAKLQVTLYALALRESYDINIDECEIVYANPETGLRVVPVDIEAYDAEAREIAMKYHIMFQPTNKVRE